MNEEWVKSGAARRVLAHFADPRPAWLWSADGSTLLWRNPSSRLFNAKVKKSGLRLAPGPIPIKGQVARLIRLGSVGRSSLSRIQFLAGGRPESRTCTVTPIEMGGGATAALIVAVDPIEPEVRQVEGELPHDPLIEALFPRGAEYLVLSSDGEPTSGSPGAIERHAAEILSGRIQVPQQDAPVALAEQLTATGYKAGPDGEQLVLIERSAATGDTIDDVRAEEGLSMLDTEARPQDQPLLPIGVPTDEPDPAPTNDDEVSQPSNPPEQSLSSLFDRLADSESLYLELPEPDVAESAPDGSTEVEAAPEADGEPPSSTAEEEAAPGHTDEPDVIAAVIEFGDDLAEDRAATTAFRVIGRGFTPIAPKLEDDRDAADDGGTTANIGDDLVDQTSQFNFDELSRILADRVGGSGTDLPPDVVEIDPPSEPARPRGPSPEGALINIAGETFILNRLPLGIMVFRDQQVLFANRALTDLVGYETIDALRAAGISAIFPSDDTASAGPVTHLVRRDGTPMPVTARLQSITWQGRAALMLSASPSEMRIGHEAAVRTFAEALAELGDEGFFEADRAGVVKDVNPAGRVALRRPDDEIAGEPISALVDKGDGAKLREFLERPARFAETARPAAHFKGAVPGTSVLLFAEGQAGIVTGYFGLIRKHPRAPVAQDADSEEMDPSMLARVSRGVRRPLNTIIGFADLIRSAAFGTIENHRYLEYARDIKTAGHEIAVLVDELDEYARLRAGRYAARPAELDLAALLESCVVRVRGQAGAARVLVRSAISERLPHVRADRASLGQAVLNLLASAIDQSPPGGTVILSAQLEEDGSVVVNVRDSSSAGTDLGERFVVFRDGVGKDGEALAPVRSSVGLALTRSLVAVNACRLSVDPAGATGTIFSMVIPPDLVAARPAAQG